MLSKIASRSPAVVALVLLLGLSGCLKKADWMANSHGGYTLMTRAPSMDQALTRFRRSADELCQGSLYAMSQPVVTNQGWSFDRFGGGSDVTVRSDLTCK